MPTVTDGLGTFEQEVFVGREAELRFFRKWLEATGPRPSMLHVCGPGGVGKTALLGAFRRLATAHGRPVAELDVDVLRADARELPRVLGASSTADLANRLARTRPLLLLDNFETLGSAAREILEALLSLLPTGVKPVLAGRYPWATAGTGVGAWHGRLRTLTLGGFAVEESRAYLQRRGLEGERLADQVLGVASGHPLSLSLAADLVEQIGVRDLGSAPEWHLVVRSLVETLLRDVPDPALRELLEAGAVVRQFDEATLAAVSARTDIGPAFGQLCRLSLVRPAARGLMLHDDVRHILVRDLQWRHKARYDALRLRALAYYRDRMRAAPSEERQWLFVERLYLWENAFVQHIIFGDDDPGHVQVDAYRPEDRQDALRIWAEFTEQTGGLATSSFAAELPRPFLERLLNYSGTRAVLARDRAGEVRGLGVTLPVCRESLPLVPLDSPLHRLVTAYWTPDELARLPYSAETSTPICGFRVAVTGESPLAVGQALVRDAGFGVLSRGGTYLVATADPAFKQLVAHMGFERVQAATSPGPDPADTFEGFVLDLNRMGVEPWIEAILEGRPPPPVLRGRHLDQAVRQALTHWRDNRWLADSELARSAAVARLAPGLTGASAVRAALQQALEWARKGVTPDRALAYQALEAAYWTRGGSLEHAAEELAVSRSTFYRLLERGIQGLTQVLDTPGQMD